MTRRTKKDDGPGRRVTRRVVGPTHFVPLSPSARLLTVVLWGDPDPDRPGRRRVQAKLYDDTPRAITGDDPQEEPIADLKEPVSINDLVAALARELHAHLTNELGLEDDHHLGLR